MEGVTEWVCCAACTFIWNNSGYSGKWGWRVLCIVTVNSVLVPVSCLLPRPRPAPRHSAAGESGGKSLRRKSVFVLQQCTADSSQSRYTAPPLRGDMKTISVKCWPWWPRDLLWYRAPRMDYDRVSLEDWQRHQPLSVLQLDTADRVVLRVAGRGLHCQLWLNIWCEEEDTGCWLSSLHNSTFSLLQNAQETFDAAVYTIQMVLPSLSCLCYYLSCEMKYCKLRDNVHG